MLYGFPPIRESLLLRLKRLPDLQWHPDCWPVASFSEGRRRCYEDGCGGIKKVEDAGFVLRVEIGFHRIVNLQVTSKEQFENELESMSSVLPIYGNIKIRVLIPPTGNPFNLSALVDLSTLESRFCQPDLDSLLRMKQDVESISKFIEALKFGA